MTPFDSLEPLLFWVFAGITAGSAVMTLISQNIVRSATWLLFALGGTAGVFFLLAADFVGTAQILVYVGGTLVLVIFGVMLTAQGPFITMKSSAAEWGVALVAGVALFAALAISASFSGKPIAKGEGEVPAPVSAKPRPAENPATSQQTDTLGLGFLGVGVGAPHKDGAKTVRTSFLLPFEIVSVHLLVVLIGAAYLARAKRRRAA